MQARTTQANTFQSTMILRTLVRKQLQQQQQLHFIRLFQQSPTRRYACRNMSGDRCSSSSSSRTSTNYSGDRRQVMNARATRAAAYPGGLTATIRKHTQQQQRDVQPVAFVSHRKAFSDTREGMLHTLQFWDSEEEVMACLVGPSAPKRKILRRMFRHGTVLERSAIAMAVHGRVVALARTQYGADMVQLVLEGAGQAERNNLTAELMSDPCDVCACALHKSASAVVRDMIKLASGETLVTLCDILRKDIWTLGGNCHGKSCVVAVVDSLKGPLRNMLITDTLLASREIIHSHITNVHFNIVLQQIVRRGLPSERELIINAFTGNALEIATSLNGGLALIQDIISHSSDEQMRLVTAELHGEMMTLACDPLGYKLVLTALRRLENETAQLLLSELVGTDKLARQCAMELHANHMFHAMLKRPADVVMLTDANVLKRVTDAIEYANIQKKNKNKNENDDSHRHNMVTGMLQKIKQWWRGIQ